MLATLVAVGMCAWFCMCGLPSDKGGGGGGVGAGLSTLLATALLGLTPAGKRQKEEEKLKHEIEMAKLRKELEKEQGGNPDDPKDKDKKEQVAATDKENAEIINQSMSDPKVMAAMSKSCDAIEDPVEKEKMTQQMNMIRCAQYDADGNPRSQEDMQQWMSENIPAEDLQAVVESANKQYGNVEITEENLKDATNSTPNVTDEDVAAEKENAVKMAKEMGPKLEADAAKRKEMKTEIERLEKEKADKQAELDKAIADAGADEEAIKKAKLAKAEFNKNMDNQIFGKKKEAAEFESKCQTAEFLNSTNPSRKERVEANIKKVEEEHKAAMEAANKEISNAGGDPKNTDPKEPATPAGKQEGEPDPEAAKKAEEAKKAAEEADAAKKKADDDVKVAEEALKKDPENADLKKALDDKKKAAEEAGKKAEETKKAADEAAKAAQTKPTEPAKTEPAKKEGETITKGVGADGEPDGSQLIKRVDKDGNETYFMATKDKDGKTEEVSVSKEDYEKAKKAADDAAADITADDETNGDDEKGGDVDADDKDTDAEEVDDGKGGKKKVLKNPAQIWHRRKKKSGGSTKSYYNKKGDSISANEFKEKMQKYKAKTKNESFQEFLRNPFVMERVSKYTSLRDRMRANIHD